MSPSFTLERTSAVDLVARYRYLNQRVRDSERNLNTAETALGIGWTF
jgi:hypothetical protein